MTYIESIIFGLVQGLAEFLPISSSGHLALLHEFLGVDAPGVSNQFYDVMLHFATLAAVCVAFWQDISAMLNEAGRWSYDIARGRTPDTIPAPRRMILLLIIATLPLFAALPVSGAVERLAETPAFVGLALIATGALLLLSGLVRNGKKTELSASVPDVFIVGMIQAIAIMPGLSRSGSTIAAGLFRRFDRTFAVRFSFLLSLPAVLGATTLELIKAVKAGLDLSILPVCLVGMLAAFISGYFSIRFVRALVAKGRFSYFAYYCFAMGIAAIVIPFFT